MDYHLDGTISLLEHTSKLIELFNGKLPIVTAMDSHLKNLHQFHQFMINCKEETAEHSDHFVSSKLWFDLQSMCLGIKSMVAIKLKQFPSSIIKPWLINQDCVENHFCQIRACNGQNSHPTFLQQESTQNSIRFGQTTISRKSNAGRFYDTSASTCSLPTGKANIKGDYCSHRF